MKTRSTSASGATERIVEVGGVRIELVYVAPTEFTMGSPPGEGVADETPPHATTVAGYWIGRYPVTRSQFAAIMGSNADPSRYGGLDNPVDHATWCHAKTFCEELERLCGIPFRLPTEAEWECACRAGTTGSRFFDDTRQADEFCWYRENASCPQPVGHKTPNPWGIHDMLGNVAEWCADRYAPYSDEASPAGTGCRRVLRGGWWYTELNDLRSARRYSLDPVGLTPDGRSNTDSGFRICVSEGGG